MVRFPRPGTGRSANQLKALARDIFPTPFAGIHYVHAGDHSSLPDCGSRGYDRFGGMTALRQMTKGRHTDTASPTACAAATFL